MTEQTEVEFYAELIGLADPSIPAATLNGLSQGALIQEGRELARLAVSRLGITLQRQKSIRSARKLKRDGWIGEDLRQDATPDDAGGMLRDQALKNIQPVLEQWNKRAIAWIVAQGSLESALQRLTTQPDELLKRLSYRKLEQALYQGMMLANLAGREQVEDEGDGDDLRLDAHKPSWLKQPFREAIAYFRQKVAIPAGDYNALTGDVHDWAFMVARMTQADLIESARWLVDRAISEGMGFDEFERSWQRLIGRRGWKPSNPRHVWTIFDTNYRGAMGAGRYQQMIEPSLLARRPIWVWRWRDSPNPRKNHQALHNKGIRADEPFWRGIRIPAGWGCRCWIVAMSEEAAARRGIEILENPPNPKDIADPGFDVPFNAESPYGGRDRASFLQEKIKQYNPALQAFLKKAIAQ
ncbi:MAG: phage minor head protein [Cyanobacteria bacterium J06607_13]